ncbi:unnamed protein product [Prorocentrum cordatum]|uniref:Uncharacterized protein n=1 Tax=Prorocentrum cordatum TaxID=2364126 RepID=A0ABN9U0C9_9DINO|nr:unnamed protein product [Polarella glacialis]
MTTAAGALRLKELFDGAVGHLITDDSPCETNRTLAQGRSADVKHYGNAPAMHKVVPDEFRPVLLQNGQQQLFPEPTAALKQLRSYQTKEKAQGDPKISIDSDFVVMR